MSSRCGTSPHSNDDSIHLHALFLVRCLYSRNVMLCNIKNILCLRFMFFHILYLYHYANKLIFVIRLRELFLELLETEAFADATATV